ncbi:MAG TPA: gamma-glutamylcyclotransferase family protein [Vineibacter sp.]|nr:gamma-glutamylcyclotransferase family protein [Vineibacter sp.]
MRFFFYGSLMDPDVLSRVIGRRVVASVMVPASLLGWRRTSIAEGSYPIVLRDKASRVDGVVVDGISATEADLLTTYEGPRYRLIRAFADIGGRGPRGVFLYQPRPGAFTPTDADWSLATWQATHKARFLAALARAMSAAERADRRR